MHFWPLICITAFTACHTSLTPSIIIIIIIRMIFIVNYSLPFDVFVGDLDSVKNCMWVTVQEGRMGHCNIKVLVAMVVFFQVIYLVVNVIHQDKGGSYSRTSTTPSPLMTTEVQVNESVEAFLYEYEAYCDQFLLPNQSESSYLPTMLKSVKRYCECIPNGLG